MKAIFSYSEYEEIIRVLRQSGKYMSYRQVLQSGADEYVVARHDVEFSVERALALAQLEARHSFACAYYFQLTNNTYNVMSGKNKAVLREIKAMGHDVGLHFHLHGMQNREAIAAQIALEARIMSEYLGFAIESFSFHRPKANVLAEELAVPGLINTYGKAFFYFTEDVAADPPPIKYISDAQHRWNYGLVPNAATINGNKRVQLLTHPYSWTPQGHDNAGNFRSLVAEKNTELLDNIDAECKHFGPVRGEL